MNKLILFVASLFVSVASFAQWVKPADPASTPLAVGEECYLFNKEAGGFLIGANDWGTRASVSTTAGHKVYIEAGTADGSYYITNYVLQGGMADQIGYMFVDNVSAIYVDNTKEGKPCNQYTFLDQGDGTFKIGLSNANTGEYTDANYPGACLGVIPEKNDTRLYFCELDNSDGYDFSKCQVLWYFVSPANYATYTQAMIQYEAAVALKASIDEAETVAGVDAVALADAKAAYANTSSTADALAAQKKSLDLAIKNAKYSIASVDNPVEVLSILGIATDFTDGTCPGWSSTTSASNKQASNGNNAKDFATTGNHYENWNGDAFTPGKIYATATDLATGVYHLNALAFTNTGADTYLFAGSSQAPVTATQIDIEQSFDAYAVVTNGTLEIGLEVAKKGPNWVGLDNVNLYYVGNDAAAYAYLVENAINSQPDYKEGETFCQASVYEDYKAACTALSSAATAEEIAAALESFNKAAKAMSESVAAYDKFYAKYEEASDWLGSTTAESDEVNLLSDYLDDDTFTAGDYNGNGGAQYILINGNLDAVQIAAETEYFDKILKDAMANAMSDGDDCTKLLVNPNFTEAGGWTAAAGISWPEGEESFRVFQAWGRVADVYQQLSGLQNGIYEMNLQAAYRPDNDADIRQTYAYINDFDVLVPVTAEDQIIDAATVASEKFAAGEYPVKVYGLVTDGTMKVGIANRLRTGEQGILWAGGVSLTFRSKNAEACAALLEDLKVKAAGLAESYYGTTEADLLNRAISSAEGISGDEGYAALVELKKALDAANQSVTLYAELKLALENLRAAIDGNASADASVVAKAEDLYSTLSAAYENKSLNNADAETAVSDTKAMTTAVKMSKPSQDDDEQDFTDLIVNNNFDPEKGNKDEKRIDGWNVEGALNGYKSFSCSFNKGTFNLSQDLAGLPKGKYVVTVQTYYRAGSYEEEAANITADKDTHLMLFYANNSQDQYMTSIMNLSEGSKGVTLPEGISTKEINGIIVPDGTGASVKCFEAGLFLNKLTFYVLEDGKATIGLRLDETIGTNDYTVVGPWHLYYYGEEKVTEEDFTDLIVNNNFDPEKGNKDEKRIDGWNVEGALNGYKSYSCSFNKGTFNLSQDLEGLPAGNYKVTVQTYYRAGSYEEEAANITAGKDTHLMKFFANTGVDNYVTSIMNLSEGSQGVTLPEGIGTKEINGIIVPDGTGASVKCYEAGLFLNELEFTVGEDGKATIGLRLDETIGSNDYTVVGPWHLYYYGQGTAIEKVEAETPVDVLTPVAYYSISGARLAAPQKGINIVKMSNGQTVKMLVK
ncbi:MAG: hypothetical protein KBT33_11155 [Prevotellaceae bacterium]|nr:hypothetical protein [Candidatus Minthosoma equi]